MNRSIPVSVVVLSFLALTACTSDGVKRGLYEGLYQKQCMDNAKIPNCDPSHKAFDQYEQHREEVLKPNIRTNNTDRSNLK